MHHSHFYRAGLHKIKETLIQYSIFCANIFFCPIHVFVFKTKDEVKSLAYLPYFRHFVILSYCGRSEICTQNSFIMNLFCDRLQYKVHFYLLTTLHLYDYHSFLFIYKSANENTLKTMCSKCGSLRFFTPFIH